MRYLAKRLIRLYQGAISPQLGMSCRYQPTCSEYAYQAIDQRGALRGGWVALRRLARCHPGRPGGYDPVPARAPGPAHGHAPVNAEESKAH